MPDEPYEQFPPIEGNPSNGYVFWLVFAFIICAVDAIFGPF